jgi:hypothetical protein
MKCLASFNDKGEHARLKMGTTFDELPEHWFAILTRRDSHYRSDKCATTDAISGRQTVDAISLDESKR